MDHPARQHPDPSEYLAYYDRYVSLVPEGDVRLLLEQQLERTLAFLHGLTEREGDLRYEQGKWSVKEVVGHMADSERIFGYRALRFARGDGNPLPGFEQDDYVAAAGFGRCLLRDLTTEFEHSRRANALLFRQLEDEAWLRRGNANGAEVSVRALAYILAGHEQHHVGVLRSRYLAQPA
jgi:hypothetical protein